MRFADLVGWIALALGALLALAFFAYALMRWRLVRRITAALGPGKMLLAASARLAPLAGPAAEAAADPQAAGGAAGGFSGGGVLMLVAGGLYFHSWIGNRELFVAGPSITYIGVPDAGKGRRRSRGPITLRYLNASGKEEGSTIRLLYPEQWAEAVRTHLIGRPG
jgi:hypothetical protein